jgi:hypothetical protein
MEAWKKMLDNVYWVLADSTHATKEVLFEVELHVRVLLDDPK